MRKFGKPNLQKWRTVMGDSHVASKHLNHPAPAEKTTVTNIINQDIHDNTTVNA